MSSDLLDTIRGFRYLVQQQADRSLKKEREIAERPGCLARLQHLRQPLRERQRDFRSLIRATEIMEQMHLDGKPVAAMQRRLSAMNKALDKKSFRLDRALLGGSAMKVAA